MSGDAQCPVKTLNNVEVQSNGIIRNGKGYIIGRVSDDIKFDSDHLIDDEEV